jgi:hypothetical protein
LGVRGFVAGLVVVVAALVVVAGLAAAVGLLFAGLLVAAGVLTPAGVTTVVAVAGVAVGATSTAGLLLAMYNFAARVPTRRNRTSTKARPANTAKQITVKSP